MQGPPTWRASVVASTIVVGSTIVGKRQSVCEPPPGAGLIVVKSKLVPVRDATRWKDSRLFGELVEQKVEPVKSLLAKVREAHHNDQPLDGATAGRALEVVGWVSALARRLGETFRIEVHL